MGENRFLYQGIKDNIFGLIPKTSYVTQTLNIKYRGTTEPRATFRTFSRISWKAYVYQITKTLSFFGSLSQNFWTSDVLIRTSQCRKLLAQKRQAKAKGQVWKKVSVEAWWSGWSRDLLLVLFYFIFPNSWDRYIWYQHKTRLRKLLFFITCTCYQYVWTTWPEFFHCFVFQGYI